MSCPRPGRALSTRLLRRHRRLQLPLPTPTRLARESNAASPSSIAVHKVDRAASRLVLKVALAVSRIKAVPDNSPADLVPSILLVPALPAPVREVPAVLVAPAAVLALAHVPEALADHALADLAPHLEAHHLRAKLRARRVPRDPRVAVAVNSIPRPKKAR